MSNTSRELRKRAIKIADSINGIEGVPISAKAKQLSDDWANGLITMEQMKAQLLAIHKRN